MDFDAVNVARAMKTRCFSWSRLQSTVFWRVDGLAWNCTLFINVAW